jgi:LSM domain
VRASGSAPFGAPSLPDFGGLLDSRLIEPPSSLQGFDEFMNVVLDDAEEIYLKTKVRKPIGRILLKGDNISVIQLANPGAPATAASSGAGAGSAAPAMMAEDR